MSKGMWIIFLSVLIAGIFTGFEIKTGIDASPLSVFMDVIDQISKIFPQTNPIAEMGKMSLLILGIIDTILLVLGILLYRWLGIISSAMAFTGGIMIVYSSLSLYGAIVIVIGALIAIILDPKGYASWRDNQT